MSRTHGSCATEGAYVGIPGCAKDQLIDNCSLSLPSITDTQAWRGEEKRAKL
jgi:hypothetical protein